MLGEHARRNELTDKLKDNPFPVHGDPKLSVPFNLPSFVLNKFSVKAFNMLFYGKNLKSVQKGLVHYDPYFYFYCFHYFSFFR